jgi:hypothetical protein
VIYTARYEFEGILLTPGLRDSILDWLEGEHATVGSPDGEHLSVTLTFAAASYQEAIKLGIEMVVPAVNNHRTGVGSGAMPVFGEVMTTEEWDRREGFLPLMSVSEIADEYGITRQGVLKMIDRGWFESARRIGDVTWAIGRDEVMLKKPRSVAEHTEAIRRGAMARSVQRHETDRATPEILRASNAIDAAEDSP